MIKNAGKMVGINLRPHDLRRHAATYASRAGTPLEILSKLILRHADLSTTQIYLGNVSDVETIRWIENLHGYHKGRHLNGSALIRFPTVKQLSGTIFPLKAYFSCQGILENLLTNKSRKQLLILSGYKGVSTITLTGLTPI